RRTGTGPASSSSTATSTGTARAGKGCATRSAPRAAGVAGSFASRSTPRDRCRPRERRLVLNPSTGAPQAQVHHLSGAPGVDHLELGALGAAPEQANTVAEHDGQHVDQDLVHETGPEALAGDVAAEYEDVLAAGGGQGRGDGLADVARDEDVVGI